MISKYSRATGKTSDVDSNCGMAMVRLMGVAPVVVGAGLSMYLAIIAFFYHVLRVGVPGGPVVPRRKALASTARGPGKRALAYEFDERGHHVGSCSSITLDISIFEMMCSLRFRTNPPAFDKVREVWMRSYLRHHFFVVTSRILPYGELSKP
ncbi:hypothetical protein Tco_0600181 [Tanacetum coccineum]|uniref:Uncharacterized protein n=1 Tax=Tanacetum coccineum TaxID=301880 RepID=A0ABQ4WB27_9ASTR